MRDIERYLEEGKSYIELEDVVQASEKLYKAAEEAIKWSEPLKLDTLG